MWSPRGHFSYSHTRHKKWKLVFSFLKRNPGECESRTEIICCQIWFIGLCEIWFGRTAWSGGWEYQKFTWDSGPRRVRDARRGWGGLLGWPLTWCSNPRRLVLGHGLYFLLGTIWLLIIPSPDIVFRLVICGLLGIN